MPFREKIATRWMPIIRKPGLIVVELSIVFLWTVWVCQPYLLSGEMVWPTGQEIIHSTQSHFMWEVFRDCGLCFLWNGSTNGGVPAFIDGLHGAPLHPLVILTALVFGVVDGTKITLILAFFLAGLAQLWLGRVVGLKAVPRILCALLAVAGGHLAGKMDNGVVPLVLATANCSLFIPAFLQFLISPSRKNTILLSAVTATALLAGQGYVQIGMVTAVLPALILYNRLSGSGVRLPWKRLGVSLLFVTLFLAFFLIPLIHFLPQWTKDVDPEFLSAQPLGYVPLNLVIDDEPFYHTVELHMLGFSFIYINFIGWIPVLLAAVAGWFVSAEQKRFLKTFWFALLFILLAASGLTYKTLSALSLEMFQMVRFPGFIAGLAIPLILAMAGMTVQALLERKWTLQVQFSNLFGGTRSWRIAFLPILVMAALVYAIYSAYQFGTNYIQAQVVTRLDTKILDAMATDELEWVQTPYGDNDWIPLTVPRKMKIASNTRPWYWTNHLMPPARFNAEPNPKEGETPVATVGPFFIYEYPDVHYASIQTTSGKVAPCTASGQWGDLDVVCESDEAGTLFVQENYWDGWTATIDGVNAHLVKDLFLAVELPAGRHIAAFRYRPLDVAVGAALTALGIASAVVYLWLGRRNRDEAAISAEARQ